MPASIACEAAIYTLRGGEANRRFAAMKVTIDVDCTPEEARRFMGLPDLTPVHEAYVEKMKAAVADGAGAEAFAEMAKAWGPMSEAGMAMWRQMLEQMGKRPGT
jgi:hypothetical protein